MEPDPLTAPISEDTPDIIRVPVLAMCRLLPYYPYEQRWIFHRSMCPQCAGESCFPCEAGGELAVALEDAKADQHYLARSN